MSRPALYKREEALNSAMMLFWKKGFHATSMKDIESVLNMKTGSVYAAFGSKENLYAEALQVYFDGTSEFLDANVIHSNSPLDALICELRRFVDLPEGHPQRQACMISKTSIDTKGTVPELAEQAATCYQLVREKLTQAFERAIELKELPSEVNAEMLAWRYQVNMNALRMELDQGEDSAKVKKLAEDMIDDLERLRV